MMFVFLLINMAFTETCTERRDCTEALLTYLQTAIMNRYKHRLMIALLAVLLPCLAGAVSVGGRGAGAHSFRGGFSSQRSQPAAMPAKSTATSFGSFNSARPAAPAKSGSALNRDLEQQQAQANAQKSLQARQQPAAAPTPASNVNGQPLPPAGAPATPAAAPVSSPPVVVVQRESGSMGGAFWGYMLGSALSRPHNTTVYTDSRNNPPLANDGNSYSGGVVAGPEHGVATVPAAAVAPGEGAGWKLLRLALWSLILGSVLWLGWRIRRAFLLRKTNDSNTHYSLGKV